MSKHGHSLFTDFTLHPVFSMNLDLHASDFIGKAQFEIYLWYVVSSSRAKLALKVLIISTYPFVFI